MTVFYSHASQKKISRLKRNYFASGRRIALKLESYVLTIIVSFFCLFQIYKTNAVLVTPTKSQNFILNCDSIFKEINFGRHLKLTMKNNNLNFAFLLEILRKNLRMLKKKKH